VNIRLQAESDLSSTLQDGESGFGFPVIIEDLSSNIIGNDVDNPFFCQVGRVGFFIDPDTGVGVDGDIAHVGARISDLVAAGFDVDEAKEYLVTTADVDGVAKSFAVRSVRPDNTLGILLLICESVTRSNAANEAIIEAIIAGLS
jgi:hypothetical protein